MRKPKPCRYYNLTVHFDLHIGTCILYLLYPSGGQVREYLLNLYFLHMVLVKCSSSVNSNAIKLFYLVKNIECLSYSLLDEFSNTTVKLHA